MFVPAAGMCDRRCDVKRRTKTSDSAGTFTESWSTLLTGVAVAFQELTASEAERYSRDGVTAGSKLYVDRDADIHEADRIDFDGRQFNVLGVVRPGQAGAYKMLVVEEVR